MSLPGISLAVLRQRLLDTAEAARSCRIANEDDGYSSAKWEVEQAIALLREQYKQDPSLFDESLLADIRVCKICAGIVSKEELAREADERAFEAYIQELTPKHRAFLTKHGVQNGGMHVAVKRHRTTHCHCHGAWLDNRVHMECNSCHDESNPILKP